MGVKVLNVVNLFFRFFFLLFAHAKRPGHEPVNIATKELWAKPTLVRWVVVLKTVGSHPITNWFQNFCSQPLFKITKKINVKLLYMPIYWKTNVTQHSFWRLKIILKSFIKTRPFSTNNWFCYSGVRNASTWYQWARGEYVQDLGWQLIVRELRGFKYALQAVRSFIFYFWSGHLNNMNTYVVPHSPPPPSN